MTIVRPRRLGLLCFWFLGCGAYASNARASSRVQQSSRSVVRPLQSSSTTPDDPPLTPRGGGNGRSKVPPIPTLQQYRRFALPCLGLWVSGPLLSLVDTSFIGQSADSSAQLAALGPATTFFDGATYLFAFLNVATTNLYAQGSPQDKEDVVRTAAQVALNCGLGLMVFLFLTGRPLLRLYIGDKAASTPGLLDAASDYVRIRALSMPTSLLLGVVQASLLGAQDSVTPLIAILYSTIVNVIGDYVLVNRLQWGLQGAALATTAAQWAATWALLQKARRRLLKNQTLGLWKKQPGGTARAFLAFAAPVLTLIVGKLAAFGFMTHSAAAVPGQPTPLACHQILLSLLFSCSPFFEVISQTAQTFLPAFEQSPDTKQESQQVATTLLGLGLASAGFVATIASSIPACFSNIFTRDATVQMAVRPLAKYLWMGAFFWAPVAVSEGVLLARRELSFLAGVYLLSTILLPPALLHIKHSGGTVAQVWACFAVFQVFRALCFTGKIWGGAVLDKMRKPKKAIA